MLRMHAAMRALMNFKLSFLNLIRKVTVLGVVAVLPLTISRIIFILDFVAKNGVFNHEDWISFNSIQMIAVFVEICAILLSFKFNEKTYAILCKYCDNGCGRCYAVEAERQLSSIQESKSTNATSQGLG